MTTRSEVQQAERIVVKVGSSSLTRSDGSLNVDLLSRLARTLSSAHRRGRQVLLVSSGAAAAGAGSLGIHGRPKDLHAYQAACMVGQIKLMSAYEQLFAHEGITVAQVLLTVDDVVNRQHYSNARDALQALLCRGIIPILNENDAVATREHRFGDNDRLAALTSHLVNADVLYLFTDVEGLYTAPPKDPSARLIERIDSPDELENLIVTGRGSDVGTGGMRTKVEAASIAASGGVPVVLTNAEHLEEALDGEPVGTWFSAYGRRSSARALWMRYAAQPQGVVIVDAGAEEALRGGGASLLAVGVRGVAGSFHAGALVEIQALGGGVIAKGISAYSSEELARVAVMPPRQARALKPVVHLNDLVRLASRA